MILHIVIHMCLHHDLLNSFIDVEITRRRKNAVNTCTLLHVSNRQNNFSKPGY